MGRIKSTLIKRTAKSLLDKEGSRFDQTFETNKRVLGNTMPSKSVRNKIAGYMARVVRMKARGPKPKKIQPVEEGVRTEQYERY